MRPTTWDPEERIRVTVVETRVLTSAGRVEVDCPDDIVAREGFSVGGSQR